MGGENGGEIGFQRMPAEAWKAPRGRTIALVAGSSRRRATDCKEMKMTLTWELPLLRGTAGDGSHWSTHREWPSTRLTPAGLPFTLEPPPALRVAKKVKGV